MSSKYPGFFLGLLNGLLNDMIANVYWVGPSKGVIRNHCLF
jgi:hypothetical protein